MSQYMDGVSSASYMNKLILAPMVRAGCLPLRLLSLQYGADVVYGEEIIDRCLLKCKRVENPLLGTVDFVELGGKCQFRTCPAERGKVVFQMGTADPENALKAARMLENDVAGIDVNMGCPKDYSIKGGMGAALLTDPDRVHVILTTLVQGVKVPVTCKIRLLPSLSDTLHLVKVIEKTGVSAVALHGRYKTERPREPCHDDLIREVAKSVSIPVIANGGSLNIATYDNIIAFREATGCSSVMVARAALSNPSVFRKEGPLPIEEVTKEFIKLCLRMDEHFNIAKYCLAAMLKPFAKLECPNKIFHLSAAATNYKELSSVHKLTSYYEELQAERERLTTDLPVQKQKELDVGIFSPSPAKRSKTDIFKEGGIYELHIKYDRRSYPYGDITPKQMLLQYAKQMGLPPPTFAVEEAENRLFKATVLIGDSKYGSTLWCIGKKTAEHSAALVALTHRNALPPGIALESQ